MTIEGVDYSFGRPGGAALAAAGKKFAVRYCPYPGDGGKGLTTAELADLQAHGIAVALVFESTAGRARGGHDAGVADGQLALKAKTALHFDADRPVYFAVDFNTAPNDYPTIDAYLRGAALAVGAANVGVYGEASLLDRMKALGSAKWFWQTYAWSNGVVSDAAHLLQYLNGQRINGAAVDLCRAFTADFGQTPKPGSTTAGGNQQPEYSVEVTGTVLTYADPTARTATSRLNAGNTYLCHRSRSGGLWWYHVVGPDHSSHVGEWFKPTRYTKVTAL